MYGSAMITGGTAGIGAAFARALPAETELILVARHEEGLDRARRTLEAQGRRVQTVAADLATDEGRNDAIAAAEARGIELLINNAGIGAFGRYLENDPDFERRTVELNAVAPTVLTRALLPGMIGRARSSGRRAGLVILSSTLAFQPTPWLATYAATKSFLLAWGEALNEELRGEPVDLLVVCPTATASDFGARAGFRMGALPVTESPDRVARAALGALGRETVHVRGPLTRMALRPFLLSRRLTTSGLAGLIAAADRLSGLRSRPAGTEEDAAAGESPARRS
ncbi:SDR family NAD(P)-dependent oxidoreductase [Arenibaculum pallidiluteum]|uniref:SDR family NAD(P)-dependent oxidoreductase n=1 Tax=Arenibaculum pallidiluteum TaxID=2812559 RepID=UPI001A964220|nr:SDR family NAD(P)-dependent oxidoreductase [Arenibaculum pallidiluteum]